MFLKGLSAENFWALLSTLEKYIFFYLSTPSMILCVKLEEMSHCTQRVNRVNMKENIQCRMKTLFWLLMKRLEIELNNKSKYLQILKMSSPINVDNVVTNSEHLMSVIIMLIVIHSNAIDVNLKCKARHKSGVMKYLPMNISHARIIMRVHVMN